MTETDRNANSDESTPPPEAHPAADLFPPMTGDEFDGLVRDIDAHALREAITIMPAPDGRILDGRHRHRACLKLGIEPKTVDWDGVGTPEAFVASKNAHRRHLTGEQKREVIEKLLKLNPNQSNRQVAKLAGVSHHTAAAVRNEGEATGQIAQLDKTVGADGKSRPAKRAKGPGKTRKTAKRKPAKTKPADVTLRIGGSSPPGKVAMALIEALGQRKAREIADKIIEIAETDDRIVRGDGAGTTAP